MIRVVTFVLLAAILGVSCSRPPGTRLGFGAYPTQPHVSEGKVGAFFWSDVYGSPAFAAYLDATQSTDEAKSLKEVTLVPENPRVARLILTGERAGEEAKIAGRVAAAINGYYNGLYRAECEQAMTSLRSQIAQDPANRAVLEARLHEAEIAARLDGVITGVILSPSK